MIVNIRGTSGSGKTHTARAFIEQYAPDIQVLNADKKKVIAHCVYWNMQPVYVLGSYKNVCGGCDSITSQDMVCSLVRHFSQFGHVIFEGLIMSHLYARYAALYKEMAEQGEPMVFAFMDTPIETCIERILQRRVARGDYRELDTSNTISKHESTQGVMKKFKNAGIQVAWINHEKDPVKQLEKLLQRDAMTYAFENSYREESFR